MRKTDGLMNTKQEHLILHNNHEVNANVSDKTTKKKRSEGS